MLLYNFQSSTISDAKLIKLYQLKSLANLVWETSNCVDYLRDFLWIFPAQTFTRFANTLHFTFPLLVNMWTVALSILFSSNTMTSVCFIFGKTLLRQLLDLPTLSIKFFPFQSTFRLLPCPYYYPQILWIMSKVSALKGSF